MIKEHKYRAIVKCLADDMNVNYTSRFTGIDVKIVEDIAFGRLVVCDASSDALRIKPTLQVSRIVDPRVPVPGRLVRNPVYRPFPLLDALSDGDRILALVKHGLAATKIRRYLSRPMSVRQIHLYSRRHLGPAVRNVNNSKDNQLGVYMLDLITLILEDAFGKDRHRCELCTDHIAKRLHHPPHKVHRRDDLRSDVHMWQLQSIACQRRLNITSCVTTIIE